MRRQALALVEEQSDANPTLLRQLRRRLAQSLQRAGEAQQAAAYYRVARPDPEDGQDEQISWLTSMALFNEQAGRIVEAADWYAELAACLSDADDAQGAVAALGNSALFSLEVGRAGQAAEQLAAMRRLLRSDQKLASRLAQYDVRMMMHQMRGRFQAAAELARRAERLARKHGPDDPSLASRVAMVAMNLRRAGGAPRRVCCARQRAPDCGPNCFQSIARSTRSTG